MNNLLALVITFVIALAWLRLMDFFAHRGWIESRLSRKLIHIGTGPIFVLCWLLFKDTTQARWLAALVPFAITLQFVLVGMGVIKDEAAVQAMSRTGDRREILRGPLYYGIVFIIMTVIYWKDSPTGIIALMLMCGGDGLADVLGRRFSSPPLPWNANKTVMGSFGMFIGGLALAAFIVGMYVCAGVFAAPFLYYLTPLLIIAAAGMLVESLPVKDVDNITVTLAAVVLGAIFF